MTDSFFDVELPKKSILDVSDYKRMYEVADSLQNMTLLTHLKTHGPETPKNLRRAFPDIEQRLMDLRTVHLVKSHSTGKYEITSLGSEIVEKGAKAGVEQCMEDEWSFTAQYS